MKPIKSPYVRAFMRFLCSHIGTCLLVIAYCVVGAFIFYHLESPNEMDRLHGSNSTRCQMENDRDRLMSRVQSAFAEGNVTIAELKEWLNEFHHNLTKDDVRQAYRITSDGCNAELKYKWSLSSAILFTVTTVATIGYGNIVPTTELSQFILICYSLFGIPLTLMFLVNIGRLFADVVRFIYHRGICYFYQKQRNKIHHQQHIPVTLDSPRPTIPSLPDTRSKTGHGPHIRMDHGQEDTHKEFVPKSFIFCILAIYSLLGTILFSWSENWTYTRSAYFNVVTLLTIGLGDFVPGWTGAETTFGQVKMGIGAAYIMLGLGLVFMGLNLIVDELMNASKKAAMKIGLVGQQEQEKKIRSNIERAVRREVYI